MTRVSLRLKHSQTCAGLFAAAITVYFDFQNRLKIVLSYTNTQRSIRFRANNVVYGKSLFFFLRLLLHSFLLLFSRVSQLDTARK